MTNKEVKQRHSQFDPPPYNNFKEYFAPILLGLNTDTSCFSWPHKHLFHLVETTIIPYIDINLKMLYICTLQKKIINQFKGKSSSF